MIAYAGHLITLGGWTLAALLGARLAFGLFRVCPRSRAAWRHLPAALWARARWRWLARNLQLAYLDQHRRASKRPAVPFGTSVKVKAPGPGQAAKLRFPRAVIRPGAFGLDATIKTIPGVDRRAVEAQAEHIANAWKCCRVSVSQSKPGRIRVRGIRTDPLLVPLDHDGWWPDQFPRSLSLGLDEYGAWRTLPLGRQVTGIVVAGLPGSGKSSLIGSWLGDLAGTAAAQFVVIDGKGGDDYADWSDRAVILTGDDPVAAEDALIYGHDQLRSRLGTVRASTGSRNVWSAGHPSEAWPLLVVVIDECHTFFDPATVKGDPKAEHRVRRCAGLAGQLIRRGGSVAVLVVLATQKPTADALPTALRDNSALAVCFAVKTIDAAVAALGDSIRQSAGHHPMLLQDPEYVGVCVASLRTGLSPFTRMRIPYLDEQSAAERAAATAPFRRVPAPTPPAPTPELPEVPAPAALAKV